MRLNRQGVRNLEHPFYKTDAIDLGIASTELAAGREQLREAYDQREPRQRRKAIDTALGRLDLATRAIRDVIERRSKR